MTHEALTQEVARPAISCTDQRRLDRRRGRQD